MSIYAVEYMLYDLKLKEGVSHERVKSKKKYTKIF